MSNHRQMYVAIPAIHDLLRLVQEQPTNIGLDLKAKDPKNGIEGVCMVFSSREAAEKWYGEGVDVIAIKIQEDNEP